jgi:hypothetical protein
MSDQKVIHKLMNFEPYVDHIRVSVNGKVISQLQVRTTFMSKRYLGSSWGEEYFYTNRRGDSSSYTGFEIALGELSWDMSNAKWDDPTYPGAMYDDSPIPVDLSIEFIRKGLVVHVVRIDDWKNYNGYLDIEKAYNEVFKKYVLSREIFDIPDATGLTDNLQFVSYDVEGLEQMDRECCYQIGCNKVAVSTFKMLKITMHSDVIGEFHEVEPDVVHIRKFCQDHLNRYNGPHGDTNSNYELYEGTLDWNDANPVDPAIIQKEPDIVITMDNFWDSDDDYY